MSRLSNPGCMLRVISALFGAIFLPVGISFFFVLKHRHWMSGIGAVAAAAVFFYVAYRANDILDLDAIPDTYDIHLPEPPSRPPTPPADAPPSDGEPEP